MSSESVRLRAGDNETAGAHIAREAAAVRRFDCCMPAPNPPLLAQDRTPLGLTLQHSRPALRSCGNSAKPKGGEGHETDEKCARQATRSTAQT